jgi:hypothetical protein
LAETAAAVSPPAARRIARRAVDEASATGTAALGHVPLADRVVQVPPTDPAAGLEDADRDLVPAQLAGGRQPGQPGPDDPHINLANGGRGRPPAAAGPAGGARVAPRNVAI